jgi:pyridinium-3,5-bisthiocarboxylic acid mononucleotide nickel chelatase
MGTIVYLDCFSGVSGDMMLGALVDAGLPLDDLRRALGSLTIDGYSVHADKVSRAGIAATKFRVALHGEPLPAGPDRHADDHAHDHTHSHAHPEHQRVPEGAHHHTDPHSHRTLNEIFSLIDRSALGREGRDRAKRLFRRLGEAEAAIHQTPLERVHLHEVGALDSIIDIVGSVFGMEWLGADGIVCSPLNVGGGMVESAHGRFPVPAPATVRLLEGVPVYSSGQQAELVTPTGALLVTEYARSFGPIPPMRVDRVGYGAGDWNPPSTPNVLRMLVGQDGQAPGTDRVALLDFEIDDMNPQIFGALMDRLYAEGALEVFYAPVQMKKNRPGTLVTIVARPADRDRLAGVVFRETTTIGLRHQEVERECLERESRTVDTPVGPIRFKIARRRGEVVNFAPEFDDCARAAAERGLSIKDVQAAAVKGYLDSLP